MKRKRNYLMFIAPGFILYTVFVIFPIIYVLFLSFTDWSGLGAMNFIGLENFKTIFGDKRFTPEFINALKNNIK